MKVKIIDIPMDTRQANETVNKEITSIKGEVVNQAVLDDRRIIVFYNESEDTTTETPTGPTGSGEQMIEEESEF